MACSPMQRRRRPRSSSWSEPQAPDEGPQRIVELVGDALLERDDGVVGDGDLLGADLRAALRDVAVSDSPRCLQLSPAVLGVERMHLEGGDVHEESRPHELLVLVVVAKDVANVLAEETLDALPELLDAVDVLLLHAPGSVRM